MKNLIQFIKNYNKEHWIRLHIPGHGGRCGFLNKNFAAKFDITEIEGADWLFKNKGLIQEIELKLEKLFGQSSALSTCGSTLCVQTMVALCGNKKIIAHRNSAHVSFFNACALCGVKEVYWWGGFKSCLKSSEFNVDELKNLLTQFEKGSCVVYLTSPNYYGIEAPIEYILKLCLKFDALLLADCAHGAHLNLLKHSRHPASLGAHLSCSSLHKTLPALTGAAVLNFNDRLFKKADVKKYMFMFSTTSPSYLTMASIDFCVEWMQKYGEVSFNKLNYQKQKLIQKFELPFLETDVSKLVVDCRELKLNSFDFAKILRLNKIEPEFVDENFVVMVMSPFLKYSDWLRLARCLKKIPLNKIKISQNSLVKNSQNKFFKSSLKMFNFDDIELIELNKAYGRVCAQTVLSNPPGTVLVASGEILNIYFISELRKLGFEKIEVVKK